ncbi:MAG: BrnT family toxin [Vulcanimicrobiaceae bacterium]
MRLTFAWDAGKARRNLAKHRVPFELAVEVFHDQLAVVRPDPEHDDRWIMTGLGRGRLLVVVYSYVEARTNEEEPEAAIRIISAREATTRERRAYRDER